MISATKLIVGDGVKCCKSCRCKWCNLAHFWAQASPSLHIEGLLPPHFLFLNLCYQTYQTWPLFLHLTTSLALYLQFWSADTTQAPHTLEWKQIIHQQRPRPCLLQKAGGLELAFVLGLPIIMKGFLRCLKSYIYMLVLSQSIRSSMHIFGDSLRTPALVIFGPAGNMSTTGQTDVTFVVTSWNLCLKH